MATTTESGLHTGDIRIITADTAPEGYEFDVWDGDVSVLDDAHANPATVTMPASNATLTALYKLIETGGYGALYNWFATQKQLKAITNGCLYNWYAATDSRGIASIGWKLPSYNNSQDDRDILTMQLFLGYGNAGGKLKETGFTHWQSPNTGATNETGFTAVGSGHRNINGYGNIGSTFEMWNSSVSGSSVGFYRMYDSLITDSGGYTNVKSYGYSIRLVKETTTLIDGQTGIYIGNDEKIYPTICIGSQEWLACNLAETKYQNGDYVHGFEGGVYHPIDNTTWAGLETEAGCVYDNDENNAATYTYLSSSDEWVVPSKSIWEDLLNSIDTFDSEFNAWLLAGGKLKEIGLIHWEEPNEGATNEYGLSIIGGGGRLEVGNFGDEWTIKYDGIIWIYDNYDAVSAYMNRINYYNASALICMQSKTSAASIRLCNPTTTHENGYIGTYTGNNLKSYNTIVINGVEWLSENLAETQFRNGDYIHGFEGGSYTAILNEDWSMLTTPALCAYNNDWSNV
jgi:uncharacterized protein (TIGR02145 family)